MPESGKAVAVVFPFCITQYRTEHSNGDSFGDNNNQTVRQGGIQMRSTDLRQCFGIGVFAAAMTFGAVAQAAGPQIVAGPSANPKCFAPWAADTKYVQYPAKKGPFRIALANGYIANTWRIQMIETAKAYAAQPDVAAKLKEFKVVSTGEDVPAQISAINNFIDSGYDAIVTDAQNPTAFGPVIKRAKDAGVVLVAFH